MTIEDRLSDMNRDLGELAGLFKAHIRESERERGDQRLERAADRVDRKAIGDSIEKLAQQSGTIARRLAPLETRMSAIDSETDEKSLKSRVGKIEPVVADYQRKVAAALAIATGGLALIVFTVQTFGADIKAFVLRVLRIS